MFVSNCCGAKVSYLNEDDLTGVCSDCKEHCDAEDSEEHEMNLRGMEYGN